MTCDELAAELRRLQNLEQHVVDPEAKARIAEQIAHVVDQQRLQGCLSARNTWSEQGPGPLSVDGPGYKKVAGAIQAVAPDPVDPNRVFVAAVGGGIWSSTNAMSATDPHWSPLTDGADSLSMSAVALSPLDRNTVYAGCGSTSHAVPLVGPASGPLLGMLRSTDAGRTWTELARDVFRGLNVTKILPSAQTTERGQVVLAATWAGGLLRSEDAGQTWTKIGVVGDFVSDVVAEPGNASRVYAAGTKGVFRSDDGGNRSWTDVSSGMGQIPAWVPIRLSISPVADSHGAHRIYALITGVALLFSPDAGGHWIDVGRPTDGSLPVPGMAASPLQSDVVFTASDSGMHWMAKSSSGSENPRWIEVPGGGRTDAAPSAGVVHTHVFVAVKGLDGNLYLNQADLGGSFGQWFPMGFHTDVSAAVCGVGDYVYFFARALDGRIFFNRALLGQAGQGWAEMPGGVRTDAPPAAGAVGTHVFVAVKALDGNLYLNQADLDGSFGQWFDMGFATDAAPAVVGVGDTVYFIAKGLDGRILYDRAVVGQGGQGWKEVEGGGRTATAPAAGAVGTDLFIAIRGLDGNLYLNHGALGGAFSTWIPLDLGTNVGAAVTGIGNNLDVFATTLDQRIVVRESRLSQWTQVDQAGANGTGTHTDARDCAFSADPNVLFETDDGGIYRLVNAHGLPNRAPRHWEEALGNIRVAEFHAIAYDSMNHIVFGAAQDNAIPQQTTPGGVAWGINEDFWGDGFEVGVDTTSTPAAAIHYSSQQSLFRFRRRTYTSPTQVSSDVPLKLVINGTGGLTYNIVEGALRSDGGLGTVRWNQSWVLNDTDRTRLLLGTDFLYESFDRGDSFDSVGGLAKNAKGEWIPDHPVGTVRAYAYGHATNPDVIYLGVPGKLLLRQTGRGLPTVIGRKNANDSNDPGTYPGATPVSVALDSGDWREAYVLDEQGRVWHTRDAGATSAGWSEMTRNLPALTSDLRAIEVLKPRRRFANDTVFAAGLGGVYSSTVNPVTRQFEAWQKHGNGQPNAVVTGLQYSADDDVLVVGTLGRAAWLLANVTDAVPAIITTDVAPAVAGVGNTVYFVVKDPHQRLYYNRAVLGQGGQGWFEIEGGGRASAAPAAGAVGTHLFAVIRGMDGQLYVNQADLRGSFGQWFPMNFATPTAAAVCGVGNNVYFFATGSDRRIFFERAALGQGDGGWTEVAGGGSTDAAPAAGAVGTHVFVAVKGVDDNLYLNQADLGGSFGQWFPMGFHTDVSPAVCGAGDNVYFFAKALDGRIFFDGAVLGHGGQGWAEVPGGGRTDAPPAAAAVGTHVFVSVKGLDGRIYTNQADLGHSFGQWFPG